MGQFKEPDELKLGTVTAGKDPQGFYVASDTELPSADLSRLPSGTMLRVSRHAHAVCSRTANVWIHALEATGRGKVTVHADYWQCPECWHHGLSHPEFMQLARRLISESSQVEYCASAEQVDEESAVTFSVELPVATFKALTEQVTTVVLMVLESLLLYRDEVDATLQKMIAGKGTP